MKSISMVTRGCCFIYERWPGISESRQIVLLIRSFRRCAECHGFQSLFSIRFDPLCSTLALARWIYLKSARGSFPPLAFLCSFCERTPRQRVESSLRLGGNKKLRAMIRNRSPSRGCTVPFFRVSSFVWTRYFSRSGTHRKYAVHGMNGCQGGGSRARL